MSQTKLARILDLIINEDTDSAADLLHDLLVEKSRVIYSQINESEEYDDEEVEEGCDESEEPIEETEESCEDGAEELEEDFGGDEKEGFAADIEQDGEEIDSDEESDGSDVDAEDDEFGGEESEASDEERIEDLEDQLAELKADFALLMGQEAEEPNHDLEDFDSLEIGDEMGGDEFGGEEDFTDEGVYMEATKFQHEVNVTVDGEKDATNKEAPYTKAPSKEEFGGKPVKIGKGDGQGKEVDKTAAKNKDSNEDNVDVPNKEQSADLKGEGKFSGTGKNSKKPSMQTKSPLTKKPN